MRIVKYRWPICRFSLFLCVYATTKPLIRRQAGIWHLSFFLYCRIISSFFPSSLSLKIFLTVIIGKVSETKILTIQTNRQTDRKKGKHFSCYTRLVFMKGFCVSENVLYDFSSFLYIQWFKDKNGLNQGCPHRFNWFYFLWIFLADFWKMRIIQ